MVMNITKISQKMKNKRLLSIEKNIIGSDKSFIVIIGKGLNLEKNVFLNFVIIDLKIYKNA